MIVTVIVILYSSIAWEINARMRIALHCKQFTCIVYRAIEYLKLTLRQKLAFFLDLCYMYKINVVKIVKVCRYGSIEKNETPELKEIPNIVACNSRIPIVQTPFRSWFIGHFYLC